MRCFSSVLVLLVASANWAADPPQQEQARKILEATGVQGGLIVHVGAGDGKVTAALRVSPNYQVHGLDADEANVSRAREYLVENGLNGPVSVDRLPKGRLPYIDNFVNLVVAESLSGIPQKEYIRVLVPNGVLYTKAEGTWEKVVKPRPATIDDWTHYLHDSTGNPVAKDDVVGPPRHLQWLGSPRWSRHHDRMASMSALVSANGRVFYIMDEGSRLSIQLPPRWVLISRDAFNGVELWKKPISTWHSHLWPLKSGPTQLTRRLVTDGNTVYVTLGIQAPVSALDAATGEVLRAYDETTGAEEIIESGGTLYVQVNKGQSELSGFAPGQNVGDQGRVTRDIHWNEKPRIVMAIEAKTGKVLWQKETVVSPFTLSATRDRVFFHDGQKIVSLLAKSGETAWSSPPAGRKSKYNLNSGPRLVIYGKVVLFAGGDRKMQSYDLDTGKELWSAPHDQSAYSSPEDLIVASGLVWSAPTTRTQDTGVLTGRDPLTGEIKKKFAPNVDTYWFHHRCHMSKATEKYLLPSRTGIEFVDVEKEDWDIHHWVRGGCLYGIMPCNGLVYAPPHDCACYPEAKLFGFNALAPASPTRQIPKEIPEEDRLIRGPAYMKNGEQKPGVAPHEWPTYRHDNHRSGSTTSKLRPDVEEVWKTKLGGRLSAVVVADGKVFAARIDAHTLYALDATTGQVKWKYIAGGRVDSPPTIYKGMAIFGSADGYVYSVRVSDGALCWKFRAAPVDMRLSAFEQVESVWPVHGNILVEKDAAYFVAGRSNFLDGGLRFFRLDPVSGKLLTQVVIDDKDPETGKDIQERLQILNMPVGLADVMSSDGKFVYMRSQRFDLEGKRLDLGPHSGQPAQQGAVQKGEGTHLFSPAGFLDDNWFHRSYWVYGKSFAGGHAGYYQAGKFAPSGRMLVFDDQSVYGFGRKPQYYRWTTPLEHQLFRTSKEPPDAPAQASANRTGAAPIEFGKTASINPAGKAVAVSAWIYAERPGGSVVSHGGPTNGYALILRGGKPEFVVRSAGKIASVAAKEAVPREWTHLVGVLTEDRMCHLFVNGEPAGSTRASELLATNPVQPLEIGADSRGSVGEYRSPFAFTGIVDEVRIYHGNFSAADAKSLFSDALRARPKDAKLVLSCSFEKENAEDDSGNKNHGKVTSARAIKGKFGTAMQLTGAAGGNQAGGSFVKHAWTRDIPVFVYGMVLADRTLFLVGPPDMIDEEESFKKLTEGDPKILEMLAEQDAALNGRKGGRLLVVSAEDGSLIGQKALPSLPVWDGLSSAHGGLYLASQDGTVAFLKGKEKQP